MMRRRAQCLLAALLVAVLVGPLVVASGAFAMGPDCGGDCPRPVSAPETLPCQGTPLLYCCDDVARAPHAEVQPAKPPLLALAAAPRSAAGVAPPTSHPRVAGDLEWRTSALRLSVVLRL